jgi:amino acid transporter
VVYCRFPKLVANDKIGRIEIARPLCESISSSQRGHARGELMAHLRRNLGLLEAIGLSLSIIAPTMAMAFNVSLGVGVAGHAVPLAFALGAVALAIVGLSFAAFARRVAHAGSAYAYIAEAFGARMGFLAGWALLLTYLTFCAGTATLTGNFFDAALDNYGITVPGIWVVIAVLAIVIAAALAYRDTQLAARLMLALEAMSVFAIVALGVVVLVKVGAHGGLSMKPFAPDPEFGWSGVGYAIVFAVLAFAGFEGAATLGEETGDPNRAIPIAVLGTVILAGVFYVFASYMQVVGFGLGNMKELAADSAPLNTLALRFGSRGFATLLDVAAAVSAFSCVLGSMSAAARMLFALGRAGLAPGLGIVHERYGTPGTAIMAVGAVAIAGVVFWAPFVGIASFVGGSGTMGSLALILVYMGVTVAEAVDAARSGKTLWVTFGVLGAMILLWPLYNSIYPEPAFPKNLWPYFVIAYLAIGGVLFALRPAIAHGKGESFSWVDTTAEEQPEEGQV